MDFDEILQNIFFNYGFSKLMLTSTTEKRKINASKDK